MHLPTYFIIEVTQIPGQLDLTNYNVTYVLVFTGARGAVVEELY